MNYSALKTVSVVIPAYNSRDTIQQAVATARAQTLRPTQIVVVDDASKDDTLEQLQAIAGPDLLVVRARRMAAAAQLAIAASRTRPAM